MRSFIKTALLLLLALLLPAVAAAYDFEVDGIYYNYRNSFAGTVEVAESPSSNKYAGDVTIPDTVAYNGSTYTVKVIGNWAFSGCNGLTSVATGDSVTMIGIQALAHCDNLTSVSIGSAVISIGNNAFMSCPRLSRLVVASDNTRFDSRDDCNAVIVTASNILVVGCQSTVIPRSVTAIRYGAFSGCSGLTSISIPSSVTAIGMEAFAGCSGLTSINIPASVASIGVGAFSGCSGLMWLAVSNNNTTYDSRGGCNAIIETATNTLIAGCQNTGIFGSVTAIGDYAFAGQSGLTRIIIPASVTSIGEYAFHDCSGLTSVIIPASVTSVGSYAFSRCSGLTSATLPDALTTIPTGMFLMCSGLTDVAIPRSVTTIGAYAFNDCSGLTSVTIPASVTSIGKWAFRQCSGLADVYSYIPDLSRVTWAGPAFNLSDKDYSGRTLHVLQGMAEAYGADAQWYPYFGQIVDDVTPDVVPGDVNGDLEVTIADVNVVIDNILQGNGYNAAADVNGDREVTIADINAIIDIILHPATDEEHEWVDLGLPSGTLWATCNVGANSPEESGDYFAWGETEPKESYTWETYKWFYDRNGWPCCTKYCTNELDGTVDNKTELDPEDDAASINWGPSWRMPSQRQIFELCDQCIREVTTINGVQGIRFIGPNGNMVFLPLAGYYNKDTLNTAGTQGYYWTRSLLESLSSNAHDLSLSRYFFETWDYHDRYLGYTVRPVRAPQQ